MLAHANMKQLCDTCVGDSITERGYNPGGWVASLAKTYSRKVYVRFM